MKEETLLAEAKAMQERIREDRHYLHSHPETGFDLEETFDYVWKTLEDMGIEPRRCGKRGITALMGQGDKVVMLRADMDALPIREDTGLPFASDSGRMHACGHDMHTAMLLGAARLLKAREKELPGRVKLMFQPAEEVFQGAADMMADGLLENPRPDAAFMIHVMTGLPIPVGTVIVSAPGVSAPAANMFEIRIQGKGCHGAMPHTGVDPVNVAAHTVLALQAINSRELSPSDNAALTIGMLQAGDTANVIPDRAVLRGSLRAMDDESHGLIRQRLKEITELTAQTFRATAELEFTSGAPTLLNDKALSDLAVRSLRTLLGPDKALLSSQLGGSASKSSGSEDFANVSHTVPSLMMALAAGTPDTGCSYPAHHPKTCFDEDALPVGAAVYAQMALSFLADNNA
ncbi:MAG: M20 family metallopeptidase [Eubacteriales bacterium]|nr:M20 family metallopeptidase [Eubacteriales bacterium]